MHKVTFTLLAALLNACVSAPSVAAQVTPTTLPAGQSGTPGDTLDPNWVPVGFGTLRQDDLALKVSPATGLQVRAIPLDERVIRLLSPRLLPVAARTAHQQRPGAAGREGAEPVAQLFHLVRELLRTGTGRNTLLAARVHHQQYGSRFPSARYAPHHTGVWRVPPSAARCPIGAPHF